MVMNWTVAEIIGLALLCREHIQFPGGAYFGAGEQRARSPYSEPLFNRPRPAAVAFSPFPAQDIGDDVVRLIGCENEVGHGAMGCVEEDIQGHRRHAGGRCDRGEARRLRIGQTNISPADLMTFGADLPRQNAAFLPIAEFLRVNLCDGNRHTDYC